MKVTSVVRAAAATAAMALGLSLLITPASADPPSPTEFRQLVGVGSATTQDLFNGLAEAVVFDPDGVPDDQLIASYDATGSATVRTRPTGCVIPRPNGGDAALLAWRVNAANEALCVDFVRADRGPRSTSTSRRTWIPFARDALTFAVRSDSPLNAAPGPNLTSTDLRAVYTCAKRTLNGVTLTPLLPPPGSNIRNLLLGQLAMGDLDVGACVDTSFQENDGTALDTAGDIAPYSVAQYIAETTGVVTDRHGDTVLGRVNGASPRTPIGTLNASFPFARDLYIVVPTAKLTGGATRDADLANTFVGPGSEICTSMDVIEAYAFAPPAALCGGTSLTGEF
ncbi:substrate-binding domain-containing protein [Streptomyces lushanensis]|uniref:substrate-binding domain-containing protein n=1 Tax=Streptomyces lushanensis TaxID=1434255 RepID=UPI00082E5B2A|nr:substrate-binding domain-containing protein [Streptomyces lushanensis]